MDARITMPISLDSHGFVRRACPTCEREFKWLCTDDESEATEPDDRGLFCPYCGVQAEPNQWFTQTQVEYIQHVGLDHVVDEIDRIFSRFNRPGSGLNYTRGDRPPAPSEPPPEPDDMRRVDLACHPEDPLKVAEEWDQPVYCLICGTPTRI